MNTKACALTTIDNPFNPFTQFKEWYMYDEKAGHKTCELLARLAITSDQMSDAENAREIERAIDEIIKNVDPLKIYKKVYFS